MTQASPCHSIKYAGSTGARRRGYVLQALTIGWMLVECFGSFIAAIKANSLPLAAFGSDSLIELLSAALVVLQFSKHLRISPSIAARLAGGLLYALCIIVAVLGIFAGLHEITPDRSYLGMGITIGAVLIMPVLALLKRRHAYATGDRVLAADAMQSYACAYLAAITLLSLLLQAWHPLWWIDSVAEICLIPLLLVEARRAWNGMHCGCC